MKNLITNLLLILPIFGVVSCTLPYTWGDNPLDRPGDEKSAKTLHTKNVRAITGNPGWLP